MKTKIKIFQLFIDKFDKYDKIIPKNKRVPKVKVISKVTTNSNGFVDAWDAFNWDLWGDYRQLESSRKIKMKGFVAYPNHLARGYCNSDIFYKCGNKWYVAESVGWSEYNTYSEAYQRCLRNNFNR